MGEGWQTEEQVPGPRGRQWWVSLARERGRRRGLENQAAEGLAGPTEDTSPHPRSPGRLLRASAGRHQGPPCGPLRVTWSFPLKHQVCTEICSPFARFKMCRLEALVTERRCVPTHTDRVPGSTGAGLGRGPGPHRLLVFSTCASRGPGPAAAPGQCVLRRAWPPRACPLWSHSLIIASPLLCRAHWSLLSLEQGQSTEGKSNS